MKKLVSIAVVLVMVISMFAGCSLFSNDALVKFDDTHSHQDPDGLTYDERIVLKGNKILDILEEYASSEAYPNTLCFDDDGNVVGMYDYDETTGLAVGMTNLATGEYEAFKEGEEVDLGKPDESKIVDIAGDATMGAVVYGNESKTVSAYFYIWLTDASASEQVIEYMNDVYGVEFTKSDDTTLTAVADEKHIESDFELAEESGEEYETKDAAAYADILMLNYELAEYKGENAYKPYDEYTDPEDLEFDEKVVLVGSGYYAVPDDSYSEKLSAMTDVLYGKDGKIVGDYTYYVCYDKEGADYLYDYLQTANFETSRVSDTVILEKKAGKVLEGMITSYKGYNILDDDSIDGFTKMIEETYFSVVCE